MLRREIKERKAVIDAELEQIRVREWRAYEQGNNEFRKQERYCKEQREVLRALEDLAIKERTMYELDQSKDQMMTVCKVALTNLAMWVVGFNVSANTAQISTQARIKYIMMVKTLQRKREYKSPTHLSSSSAVSSYPA